MSVCVCIAHKEIRARKNNLRMNQPDFDKFVTVPFHLCSHIFGWWWCERAHRTKQKYQIYLRTHARTPGLQKKLTELNEYDMIQINIYVSTCKIDTTVMLFFSHSIST